MCNNKIMLNTDAFIELARRGLLFDREAVKEYLESLAAQSANSRNKKLYRELSSILEEYFMTHPQGAQIGFSGYSENDDRAEQIWLDRPLRDKVEQFISVHSNIDVPSHLKSGYRRLLLYGPPGSGKTTLGYYIASRLHRRVEYVRVSDIISSKFGETTHNIAQVFEGGGEKVIFIDEFDAFAKSRYDTNDVGELKRIVNSLIQTLDFSVGEKMVIVATNLVETLDPAILRRFPLKIEVGALNRKDTSDFIRFLIAQDKEGRFEASNDDIKLMVDIFSQLGIKTVDAIRNIFDQALVSSTIRKEPTVTVIDIMITTVMYDYTTKERILHLKDTKHDLFKRLIDTLKVNYSYQDLASMLGMHRNSLRTYYAENV